MPSVIAPVTDADNRFFWEGVREGRLLLQKCSSCGALRHPPGPMCPACQSLAWEAVDASGRGTIYSWVVSQHPTEPDTEPRTVVLVDLEEGVRLVANLVGGTPVNDAPVEVGFASVDGVALPQFRLAR
jgi:uncharacterized protein